MFDSRSGSAVTSGRKRNSLQNRLNMSFADADSSRYRNLGR